MPSFAFQDEHLHVTVEQLRDRFTVALRDQTSGKCWGPVPLLTLEAYDKAQFRCDTVAEFRIDQVQPLERGLHVTVGDGFRRLRLGLWVRLEGGELTVTLPLAEVYEDKAAVYRIFTIAILPGLLHTGGGGQLLLPLNTGLLCNPAGKPKVADRFMIYGEQCRWELLPMLPVAAVKQADGGLMVLASQGAAETECLVATDGQGAGEVGFGFCLRQHWPDKVEFATRQFRYRPLAAGDDLVHTVAKRLRRHVMRDLGKPTLEQRAAESPEVKSLLGAYIMKLFYGVENEGIMMYGQTKGDAMTFRQVMSFAEAQAGLEKVRAAGIDRVHTQSVGWNPRGHDGLYPTRFPLDERLGGEAGFRALVAAGQALNFTMNVHDNYLSAYRGSPDYRDEDVVYDLYGAPMGLGEWGGGITYILSAISLPEERVSGMMRRVKALGLNGAGYCDGMGNPLYRDYHPRHPGTRTDYARGTNRIIEAAKNVYGAAGTECGFLYCVIPSDSMVTPGAAWHLRGCRPEWPITALLERIVPLWQLALHGLIILENHGEDWPNTMRCVLMGDHPRTEWSAHPGIMPVLDDALVVRLRARYDVALNQFGHLQTTEMMRWEAPDAGVEQTTFADGTVVQADFRKQELVVNGQRVARPAALA